MAKRTKDPTPREIEKRSKAIRDKWTPRQWARRRGKSTWDVPMVELDRELRDVEEEEILLRELRET